MTTTDTELDRRPVVGATGEALSLAQEAVARLVGELQAGFDSHDAEVYNGHFAADVLWGNPFGATVLGYEELHPTHARLLRDSAGGTGSRYRVVEVRAIGDDVAVAQVARDSSGVAGGSFSEVALYVLVRRAGEWWLLAGQNTVVRPAGDRPAGDPR